MVYAQTRICPGNETQKILRDFKIQTNRLIPARRLDLMIVKKKKKKKKKENLPNIGLCRPSGPQNENQRKGKERQVLGPCRRTKPWGKN